MARMNAALFAFNRGRVGSQALARVDLERMKFSAEEQTNFIPRSVGSMTLRPGLQYIDSTKDNAVAVDIPFIYSNDQTAILECTDSLMRPLVDEVPVTRPSVSTTISDGTFDTGSGWTLSAVGGGSALISGGLLYMACIPIDSTSTATQTLTIGVPDQNVEHALRIVVGNGPVVFKIGTTSGGDELVSETVLDTGTHSIAFTPTSGSAYLTFECRTARQVYLESCTIESAGDVELPAFWTEDDLPNLRYAQSGNIVFLACYGNKPHKIERRGTRSWSVVEYVSYDGPFQGSTSDSLVKFSIDVPVGVGTLTSSRPFFKSTHVGAKFRVFTPGYNHKYYLGQAEVYAPAVRVSGVGGGRNVTIVTTGTWSGTLTVQKSFVDSATGFSDYVNITTNTTTTISDSSDNVIMWVRVGFKTGGYTSGLAEVTNTYAAGAASAGSGTDAVTSVGGRYGVCEVTAINSQTSANVIIYSYFTSSVSSNIWYESEWSDNRGWPSAVAFHEGRLVWGGRDQIWGSISDSYYSFNPAQEGDSGPLQRSIGYGPAQRINFLVPLTRMVVGAEASEVQIKSSQFDEPLTPTNFTMKDFSTIGSANVGAVKVDGRCFFAKKGGGRLLEAAYSVESQDYATSDATKLIPDCFLDRPIVKMVVQRQPDTRVHCICEDGTVVIYVFEPNDDVRCIVDYETDGYVEDACVLPGTGEDNVYYIVRRVIDGNTVRYREKWAKESECVGSTVNRLADSHITYSGAATTTITGLDHLEGAEVVVWGNGKDLGTKTVTSGQITGLSEAVTSAVVGLGYEARFQSTKLAYAAAGGTALTQKKRVDHLGLVLYKTHYQGLWFGRDFDNMDNLPLVKDGADVAADTIHDEYDHDMQPMNGAWETDSRLCLKAVAPRPCTVLAAVISITTSG